MIQRLRLHPPNVEDPGSILGQGTRSHKQQLCVCIPQLNILHISTKTKKLKHTQNVIYVSAYTHTHMLKIQAVKERHKMKSENYQSSHSLLYCTFSPKITTVKSFLKFLLFKNCAHTMYLYIHNILFLYTKTHTLLHTLFFLVLYLRNLSVSAV